MLIKASEKLGFIYTAFLNIYIASVWSPNFE